MQATIQVTVKDVYGQELVYPVCDQAKRLAALVGTKTLTTVTLRQWVAMGGQLQYVGRFGNGEIVSGAVALRQIRA